jgi:hypothetical protein
MGSWWVISRYYWNGSMTENELDRAWSASYGGDMKYILAFGWKRLKQTAMKTSFYTKGHSKNCFYP